MAEGEVKKAAESKSQKRKRQREAFIYGNYHRYYGYRIDRNQEEDPRLAVFKKEWFEGKDCLDVGCNEGVITIRIATKYHCRSILGVDIDAALIETAQWNLRKSARKAKAQKRIDNISETNGLTNADSSNQASSDVDEKESCNSKKINSTHDQENLLDIVSFRKENFIMDMEGCSEQYDTILCLSVSKWIHLNWGDDGLIKLFVKIWGLLRPGGIFIFEPQPWSSYKSKRLVSEVARTNCRTINIFPHRFRDLLLDKIGFRSAETITSCSVGTVAGFNRSIMVFVK